MNLDALGFDAERWADVAGPIARVAADFGVELRVVGEIGDERAVLAGRLRHAEIRPAVGDFVRLDGEPGAYVVADVLPRKSELVRQAAGRRTQAQTIAANLDLVFVVTAFNRELSPNRIERYLTAIAAGGVSPVILVNKVDLVSTEESDRCIAKLRARLGDVPIVVTSALSDRGVDALDVHLKPRATASFVGSSGVGKSTLVNRLLGEERQVVGEIRASDDRGRHTTAHRELFVLQTGAIVIDTPGMREFQLFAQAEPNDVFDDVVEIARTCRFRDCAHAGEPGCAVIAAVDAGELAAERLESWRKLAARPSD